MSTLCIGLHIRKCAGTSLVAFILQRLAEQQVYIFSSFINNFYASRPEFFDIKSLDRLRFVFGHHLSENMLKVLYRKKTFLFTGLRDPRKAVLSDFMHLAKIAVRTGAKLPNAQEYITTQSNFLINRLLLSFPTAASLSGCSSRLDQAFAVLTLFDHIYDSHNLAETSRPILQKLNITDVLNVRENQADQLLKQNKEFMLEYEKLQTQVNDCMADDILLYERYLKCRDIQPNNICRIAKQAEKLTLQKLLSTLPSKDECLESTKAQLMYQIAYEAVMLKKEDELISALKGRVKNSEQLIEALYAERSSP